MLNDTAIRSLKPLEKPKKYSDEGGLYLYVPKTGSRLWRMDYRFDGKRKFLSFGEYPAVTLKMAREKREEAKRLLADGVDPGEHKKQQKAMREAELANTFENIAREWHSTQTLDCTEANRIRKIQTLEKHCFPAFGNKPIDAIELPDVLSVLKMLEARNHKVSLENPMTRQALEILPSSAARLRSPILCLMTFWLKLSIWELRWAWCPVDGVTCFHQNGVPLSWQGPTVRSSRDYLT